MIDRGQNLYRLKKADKLQIIGLLDDNISAGIEGCIRVTPANSLPFKTVTIMGVSNLFTTFKISSIVIYLAARTHNSSMSS